MFIKFKFFIFVSIYISSAELASITLTGPIRRLKLITEDNLIVTPSTPVGSIVGVLKTIYDRKYPATPVYSLMRNYSDSAYFSIDHHTGTLYTRQQIDRPIFEVYTIGVSTSVGNYTEGYVVNVEVKYENQPSSTITTTSLPSSEASTSFSSFTSVAATTTTTSSRISSSTSSIRPTTTTPINQYLTNITPSISTTESTVKFSTLTTTPNIVADIGPNISDETEINDLEYCSEELMNYGTFQLEWPTTRSGRVSEIDCSLLDDKNLNETSHIDYSASVGEEKSFITRYCKRGVDGTIIWDQPNFGSCYLRKLKNIENLIKTKVVEPIGNNSDVVASVVNVLENIVNDSLTNREIAEYMFTVIDNLLPDDSGRYIDQNSSATVLGIINDYAENAQLSPEEPLEINKSKIALYLTVVDANDIPEEGFSYKPHYAAESDWFSNENPSIVVVEVHNATIPKEAFRKIDCKRCRLNFISFKNRLLHRKSIWRHIEYDEISPVIAIEIDGYTVDNLSVPITYRISKNPLYDYTCVYWDEIAENWTEDGLNTSANKGDVICRASHLTSFSVLLDPVLSKGDLNYEEDLLNLLSIYGSGASVIGLAMTIWSYAFFWSQFRPQLRFVTMNLSISLLLMNLWFLMANFYSKIRLARGYSDNDDDAIVKCYVILSFLRYFVLTSLCWMFAESWNMYQMLVVVFVFEWKLSLRIRFILCWCIPLVVVSTINVYVYIFRGTGGCIWFEDYRNAYWLFYFVPSVCIILANMVLLICVLFVLYKKRRIRGSAEPVHNIRIQAKGYFTIITLTGVPWIFSVFMIGKLRIIFQYIFVVTNSLQGLIIFVTKCAFNPAVKQCLTAYLNKDHDKKGKNKIDPNERIRSDDNRFSFNESTSTQLATTETDENGEQAAAAATELNEIVPPTIDLPQ